jgi:hypothetical protein
MPRIHVIHITPPTGRAKNRMSAAVSRCIYKTPAAPWRWAGSMGLQCLPLRRSCCLGQCLWLRQTKSVLVCLARPQYTRHLRASQRLRSFDAIRNGWARSPRLPDELHQPALGALLRRPAEDAPPLSQAPPGFGDELLLSPATTDVPCLFPKPCLSTGGIGNCPTHHGLGCTDH